MRILIDIGHPGHVHFFKNFISEMKSKGHEILVIAKRKEVTYELLRAYRIPYVPYITHHKGILGKVGTYAIVIKKIYSICRTFKPDIALGIADFYLAQVCRALGIRCYIFDDTEHSKVEIALYKPFATRIITPACFMKNLGKKQVRYNGFHELAYLHPNYFSPDPTVLKQLGVKEREYFVLRFVAWGAAHDVGKSGLSYADKYKIIEILKKRGKVFISSEKPLPRGMEGYRMAIPPEQMHDALYFTRMVISEGGTTATEAAVLGVPTVHITPTAKFSGVHNELKRYELKFFFNNLNEAKPTIEMMLKKQDIREIWQKKRAKLLKDKIDVTKWVMNFVES
ncbi:hypothetical protein DRJ48_02435 [Candidatus Woesearchaeota archaeon]|nr:MAG: hypothetical protein DRJ48_02435 [Candidatus Woesearchaeota archaeon]